MLEAAMRYAVEEMGQPQILTANGKSYSTEPLEALSSPRSLAAPLEIHTLDGLVVYLNRGFDGQGSTGELAVAIDSPTQVRLVDALDDDFRLRETLVKVNAYASTQFPFGTWMDPESFTIAALSLLQQDDQVAALLKLVGNLSSESVRTYEDDGVSQRATAMVGIAKKGDVVVKGSYRLAPFRTFPELVQPTSMFALRLRGGGDGDAPEAALFEVADNGWRIEAVKSIRDRLAGEFAENNITVPILA